MKDLRNLIDTMLVEEWRLHTDLFGKSKILGTPVLNFLIAFGGLGLMRTYLNSSSAVVGSLIVVFGLFSGLAAASSIFMGRDASKNVLSDKTFVIYSSRTLPLSGKTSITAFFVKNLIFYFSLYLIPIGLGVLFVDTALIWYVGLMFIAFMLGEVVPLMLDRIDYSFSRTIRFGYSDVPGSFITNKSVLDLFRSSGGVLKMFFGIGALIGLYWFSANYIPVAGYLLENALLSFSVILGVSMVNVFNWLTTYDSPGDYGYLPVSMDDIVGQKINTFKLISYVLCTVSVLLFYAVNGGRVFVGLILANVISLYTGAVSFYFAGLNPSKNMVDSWKSLKFMVALNVFIIPLLGYTAMGKSSSFFMYVSAVMVALTIALNYLKKRQVSKITR